MASKRKTRQPYSPVVKRLVSSELDPFGVTVQRTVPNFFQTAGKEEIEHWLHTVDMFVFDAVDKGTPLDKMSNQLPQYKECVDYIRTVQTGFESNEVRKYVRRRMAWYLWLHKHNWNVGFRSHPMTAGREFEI